MIRLGVRLGEQLGIRLGMLLGEGLGVAMVCVLVGNGASAQSASTLYANVLDRRGVPAAMRDTGPEGHQRFSPLFDHGSWHGYLLPEDTSSYGAFTGPMVVAEEYSVYLASALERLAIIDADGKARDWGRAQVTVWSSPGVLRQRYQFADLAVTMTLRFASARTAVITTTLTDLSGHARRLRLRWSGALLDQWDRSGRTVAQAYPSWTREVTAGRDGIDIALGRVRDPVALMLAAGAGLHLRRSVTTTTKLDHLRYASESVPLPLERSGTLTVLTTETFVCLLYTSDAADE